MITVIHHDDMDGRCSAAIVRLFSARKDNIDFVEMTYKDPLELDKVKGSGTVYVVDFSLQNPGDWERLIESVPHVIWIDHHASAIAKPGPQNDLPGLRALDSGSAAMLVYKYLMNSEDAPRALQLVSDFDTWAWEKKNDLEPVHFMYGMQALPDEPESRMWTELLTSASSNKRIDEIVEIGKHIKEVKRRNDEHHLKNFSFETEFEGRPALAVCLGESSSFSFGDSITKYPFLIAFCEDGEKYKVSVYTKDPQLNLSKILMKYGGGGHSGAGGFTCMKLPFKHAQ